MMITITVSSESIDSTFFPLMVGCLAPILGI